MIGGVSDDLLAADQEDESLNTYKATLLGRLLYPTTSRLPVLLKILFIAPPPSRFYRISLLKYRTGTYRIFCSYKIPYTSTVINCLHVFSKIIALKYNAAYKVISGTGT
jgi:hypothetical protein